jgi:hypothetical protein
VTVSSVIGQFRSHDLISQSNRSNSINSGAGNFIDTVVFTFHSAELLARKRMIKNWVLSIRSLLKFNDCSLDISDACASIGLKPEHVQ